MYRISTQASPVNYSYKWGQGNMYGYGCNISTLPMMIPGNGGTSNAALQGNVNSGNLLCPVGLNIAPVGTEGTTQNSDRRVFGHRQF